MGKVVFMSIREPRNTREFLEQSSLPFHQIVGAEEKSCCKYVRVLQAQHAEMALLFQEALKHDAKANSIKPFLVSSLYTIAKTTAYSLIVGLAFAFFYRSNANNSGYPLAKNVNNSQHPLATAVIASIVFGVSIGSLIALFNKQDVVSFDLRLRAKNEQQWMKSKLPTIIEKLKAVNAQLDKIEDPVEMEKEENKELNWTATQLLSLQTYFETISNRNFY